jgi:hypothetical protein
MGLPPRDFKSLVSTNFTTRADRVTRLDVAREGGRYSKTKTLFSTQSETR